jgi:hypothetical protein
MLSLDFSDGGIEMTIWEELNSVRLPYLAARADVADALVEASTLTPVSSVVTIYARALSVSSNSFTNRLVQLLAAKGFRQLIIRGGSRNFRKEVEKALISNPTLTLKQQGAAGW